MTALRRPAWIIGSILVLLVLVYIFSHRSARMFPELGDDVQSIRITDATATLTFERSNSGNWQIPVLGGVAADSGKIEGLLATLKDLRRGESKTSDPGLHDSVGLGNAATRLQLQDDNGKVLADLLLGQISTADADQRFARLPDNPQTFLVTGLSTLSSNGLGWTTAMPPVIATARLRQITLIDPALQRMTLERRSDGHWSRTDVAATNEARADLLAEAVSGIKPDAMRSAASINWFNAHIVLADSSDGLQYSMQARREKDVVWIRLNAAARQDATADIRSEAVRINGLRQIAFGVRGDAAQALVGTVSDFALQP